MENAIDQPGAAAGPRFICDVHLGTLARRLRLLGFDTLYRNDLEDEEIVRTAAKERRIVLTRDGGILSRRGVAGYRPASIFPDAQVREVVSAFGLRERISPFSRCIACNDDIVPVDRESVIALVPPRSGRFMKRFWQCRGCGKIYWQGSHYEKLRRWIGDVVTSSGG
jgi:uncharacterized protein with PIN domain